MSTKSKISVGSFLSASPVIPVVTLADVAHAVPLARALVRGGIRIVEITLRTPVALDAIRAIASEVPEILLGAGTVLGARDLENAARAGAAFAISPGATPALLAAAKDGPIPFLPGVATPSEIMSALEFGFDHLKVFPASVFGGVEALKALSGPFPGVRICPTGGITIESAPRYLALANVCCVGGSWLTPAAALASGNWAQIEQLAHQAASTLGKLPPIKT
jgi:2-dehydro-3-deoxyphosphogluconate aldolase / (4S)-4-hydroxy-2-oxoglutarate aldolase